VATFTYDLATTVGEREIVALHPSGEPGPYPAEVRHRIRRDDRADYEYMAHALNECGVDVVSLQYESGIWGGDGAYVLDFARALQVPMVATLHNIPALPSSAQRDVILELADLAEMSVVMSRTAARRMETVYGLDARRLELVPHGVFDLPFIAADTIKPKLGLRDKAVILSFGLLAPRKGFEAVIEAMPAIVEAVPNARYIILGTPSLATDAAEGEAYRAALEARVVALGMTEQIKFIDRFVGRVEMGTWLEAADVFAAPALDLTRSESGTLAYAMGAGRAIVSTPTAYASEMLADGRGKLVPTDSPDALATTIVDLLTDNDSRSVIGRLAYEHTRGMVWWEIGRQYRQVFERAAMSATRRPLPRPSGRRPAAAVV
jgi:glycosyltransferase involved in cell wall biosynthesis